MTIPTKPGQPCRVIGGRSPLNGEGTSPNQNKIVTTVFLHDQKAGVFKAAYGTINVFIFVIDAGCSFAFDPRSPYFQITNTERVRK